MQKRISPKDLESVTSERSGQSMLDGMSTTNTPKSGGASMELTLALLWYEHAGEFQKKYGLRDYDAVLDMLAERMTGMLSRENLQYIGFSDLENGLPEGSAPCTLSKEVVDVLTHALEMEEHGAIVTLKRAAASHRKWKHEEFGVIEADGETVQAQKMLVDALVERDRKLRKKAGANKAPPPEAAAAEAGAESLQPHAAPEEAVDGKPDYVVCPVRDADNPIMQEMERLNRRLVTQVRGQVHSSWARQYAYRRHIVAPQLIADGMNEWLGGNKAVDEWDFFRARPPGRVQGVGHELDQMDFESLLAAYFFQRLKYQEAEKPDDIVAEKETCREQFDATPDSDRREVFYKAVEAFYKDAESLDIVRGQYHARKNFSQLMRIMMTHAGLTNPSLHAAMCTYMKDDAPPPHHVGDWASPSSRRTPTDEQAEVLADKVFRLPPAEKTEFLHAIKRARWGDEADKRLKALAAGGGKPPGKELVRAMFGQDASEESVRHMALDLRTYTSVIQGVLDGQLPLTEGLAKRIGDFYVLSDESCELLARGAQKDAKTPAASDTAKMRKYTNAMLADALATDGLGDVIAAICSAPDGLITPQVIAGAAKHPPEFIATLDALMKRDTPATPQKYNTVDVLIDGLHANKGAAAVLRDVAQRRRPYLSVGHTLDCHIRTGESTMRGYAESLNRDFGLTLGDLAEMSGLDRSTLYKGVRRQTSQDKQGVGNEALGKLDARLALNGRQKALLRLITRGDSISAMEESIARAEKEMSALGHGQHDTEEGRAIATRLLNELIEQSGLTQAQIAEPLTVETGGAIGYWRQGINWRNDFIKSVDALSNVLTAYNPEMASRVANVLLALPQHYTLKDFADHEGMKPEDAVRAIRLQRRETREEFVASLERIGREIIPDFEAQKNRNGISYSNLAQIEGGRNGVNDSIAAILSKMAEEEGVGVIGAKEGDIAKLRGAFESNLTGKKFLRQETHDMKPELEQLRATRDRKAFFAAMMQKLGYTQQTELSNHLTYEEGGGTRTVDRSTVGIWIKKGAPIVKYAHAEAVANLAGYDGEDKRDAIDLLTDHYRKKAPVDIIEMYLRISSSHKGSGPDPYRKGFMKELRENRHFAYRAFATEVSRLARGCAQVQDNDIEKWENHGIPGEYYDAAMEAYRVPEPYRDALKVRLVRENPVVLGSEQVIAQYKRQPSEMLVRLRRLTPNNAAAAMAEAFNQTLGGVTNDRGWAANVGETTVRRWESQGYFPDYALEAALQLYAVPDALKDEVREIVRDSKKAVRAKTEKPGNSNGSAGDANADNAKWNDRLAGKNAVPPDTAPRRP